MIKLTLALLSAMMLSSCVAGAALGVAGATAGAVVGATVKTTGAVVGAVTPDGHRDDKDKQAH